MSKVDVVASVSFKFKNISLVEVDVVVTSSEYMSLEKLSFSNVIALFDIMFIIQNLIRIALIFECTRKRKKFSIFFFFSNEQGN